MWSDEIPDLTIGAMSRTGKTTSRAASDQALAIARLIESILPRVVCVNESETCCGPRSQVPER